MKTLYGTLMIAGALLAGATTALAGENAGAKILVHVGSTTTKNQCTSQTPENCRDAVVTGNVGGFYHLYVCVGNHSDSLGVAGVQFGVEYDANPNSGVDVFSWNQCATLEFAMDGWPNSQTGTIVTWDRANDCQYGPSTATVGYFYVGVYSPDRFILIPRPNDGFAKVADCNSSEDDLTLAAPSALGYADFAVGDGYNPCSTIVPTRSTTWGGVKSLYR